MPKVQIPIDIGYYESDSQRLANQNCINLYPHNPDTKDPLSTGALLRTPGIESTILLGTGPGRGFHKSPVDDRIYAVSGNQLFFLNTPSVATLIGTIVGTGRVSMASNGEVLCLIVPGVTGYFYDFETAVLTEIVDSTFTDMNLRFGGVTSVALKDFRFFFNNDREIQIGSVIGENKGRNFDGNAFNDITSSSDPIQRLLTLRNELVVLGSETIDFFQSDNPTEVFPYARVLGSTIPRGIRSRFGVVQHADNIYFLGNSEFESVGIYRLDFKRSKKISTYAIDTVIQAFTEAELSAVTAWTYSQDGSSFAGFSFPGITLVYDINSSVMQERPVWHQRASMGSDIWRVQDVVSSLGVVLVSDNTTADIGRLERTNTREYGNIISREFTGSYVFIDSDSFTVSSVELSSTVGVGVSAALPIDANPSENPVIELQFSTDGGLTFVSAGNTSLGQINETLQRLIWYRLGRANYSFLLRFRTTDMVNADWQRLDINIKR